MTNEQLKPLIKYGSWALIALIVVIVAAIIVKIAKRFLTDELTQAQMEHINANEINANEVTIPKTEMNSLVAKLKTAFGSYGWATDEDAVYDVFESLNSRSDVLSLINACGVVDGHTLVEWMNKELDSDELEHIQNILTSKGIVYQF